MKLLFLHGAIKNAGDFLIAERSQALLKSIVPSVELYSIWEGSDSSIVKEYLPKVRGIVFGGGPFFTNNIYPNDIPLVENLRDIELPMLNIGGGWYAKDNSFETVKDYEINTSSIELLKKIQNSSGCLSCRDWFTVNMLKEKGFNAMMHGCPAWYNLDCLYENKLIIPNSINKIAVSDNASSRNYLNAKKILIWLRNKYPKAIITYVLHRGYTANTSTESFKKLLKDNNITCIDISGSCKGFSIYDDCDIHIGFRVHAHIYNLSRRKMTILLEEDGRGAGVNQALGLPSILVYNNKRYINNKLLFSCSITTKYCKI